MDAIPGQQDVSGVMHGESSNSDAGEEKSMQDGPAMKTAPPHLADVDVGPPV